MGYKAGELIPQFADVKRILDTITEGASIDRMRQAHESEDFGWDTKDMLVNSIVRPQGPGGQTYNLVDLELVEQQRGDETNLVKSLRDPTGVDFNQRMPLRPPPGRFATAEEIETIVSWLNAGMPDSGGNGEA